MSNNTSIEWTDATWNPVSGCTKVSEGCRNCYAERFADRGMGPWKGRAFTDVRCHEDRLSIPLKWKKPRRVFINSMSDLFHNDVPDSFIDRVLAVMALCPRHTFQVLTKRAERLLEYMAGIEHYEGSISGSDGGYRIGSAASTLLDGDWIWGPGKRFRRRIEEFIANTHDNAEGITDESGEEDEGFVLEDVPWPLPNLWLGVSVEDQKTWNERTGILKCIPAAKRFVSLEPMLEGVNPGLVRAPTDDDYIGWHGDGPIDRVITETGQLIHQIICGGESGPHARPFNIDWARSLRDQCKAAGVPYFLKQLGARPCEGDLRHSKSADYISVHDGRVKHDGSYWMESGRWLKLKHPKGGDPAEWPADLRGCREVPS